MAPTTFYRVVDEFSQTRVAGYGLLAADSRSFITFEPRNNTKRRLSLEMELHNHLNWANREPTVFISVYSDQDTAWAEARRRERSGRTKVTVMTINVSKCAFDCTHKRLEYRNVRKLASKLEIWIDDGAWHNSEHEWIFLHRIPSHAIVRECRL